MSPLCVACGHQGPDDARFCVRCGAALTAPAPAESQGEAVLHGLTKRCDRCGTANNAPAGFCHHCGWDLASTPLVSSAQMRPAGFWVRLGAYLLDIILLGIVVAIGAGAAAAAGAITQGNQTWSNLAAQLGTLVYFTLTVGLKGASAGKWALGLRIVRTNGGRVSILRSFLRYLVLSLIFLPMSLGVLLASGSAMIETGRAEFSRDFSGISVALIIIGLLVAAIFVIWLTVSQQKRGWHDLVAGTRVVRVR